MRKSLLFTFAAALLLVALPTLADSPAAVDGEVTLEQIFAADPPTADLADAADATEATEAEEQAIAEGEAPLFMAGENCGGVVCGKGTYCCNASCGWCRPYGMSCIQIACN